MRVIILFKSNNINKILNSFYLRNISSAAHNTDEPKVSHSSKVLQEVKPWNTIPGPPSLPIIGQFYHFMPGGSLYVLETYPDIAYKQYGPIVRLDAMFGRPPHLLIFDPESAEKVFRGENLIPTRTGFPSLKYYREIYSRKREDPFKPRGLVTDQGKNWKDARSAINPYMLPPKTVKKYSKQLEKVACDMIERLKSLRNENNMIKGEFDIEMNLWALESIGVVAIGDRLNCFDFNLPDDSKVKELVQCVHNTFAIANELDFKPNIWRYFKTLTFKKAMKVYEEHERFSDYLITLAKENLQSRAETSEEEKGFLQKLIEKDEHIAKITASDTLLAGIDTTANAMLAILYYLASNPDKQRKLRDEIASGTEKIYLKACIKEALRLRSVAFANMRETTREYNLMGYKIPKGVYVVTFHNHMCLMENQFPRPDEYIPERWIEKGPLSYRSAHPFAFSPFGFGTRICVGHRMADLQLEIFVTKIIQNFRMEWFGPPPGRKQKSINYVTGPFNFIFKD